MDGWIGAALFVALAAAATASGCRVGTLVFVQGDGGPTACQVAGDCDPAASQICQANVCVSSCTDGVEDGSETDVDCGGDVCQACPDGEGCAAMTDCVSGYCDAGTCVSQCMDGVQDGDETDVDCGGPLCPPCGTGKVCNADSDCASNVCLNAVCK